jgi:hypothetical protein
VTGFVDTVINIQVPLKAYNSYLFIYSLFNDAFSVSQTI